MYGSKLLLVLLALIYVPGPSSTLRVADDTLKRFYHPGIGPDEGASRLNQHPPGSFLVRESRHRRGEIAVDFVTPRIGEYRFRGNETEVEQWKESVKGYLKDVIKRSKEEIEPKEVTKHHFFPRWNQKKRYPKSNHKKAMKLLNKEKVGSFFMFKDEDGYFNIYANFPDQLPDFLKYTFSPDVAFAQVEENIKKWGVTPNGISPPNEHQSRHPVATENIYTEDPFPHLSPRRNPSPRQSPLQHQCPLPSDDDQEIYGRLYPSPSDHISHQPTQRPRYPLPNEAAEGGYASEAAEGGYASEAFEGGYASEAAEGGYASDDDQEIYSRTNTQTWPSENHDTSLYGHIH